MAQSLDIWSAVIIVSIAHSIFAINLLAVKGEFREKKGLWLLLFLLSLLWLQLEFLAIRWPFDIGVGVFYGTRHGSWLLMGPLYFFYMQSITRDGIKKWEYLYLLPFVLFTILIPVLLSDFLSFRQVHYGMLTPFDPRPEELTPLQYFYSYLFIFQFLYLAYFLILTRKEINRFVEQLKKNISNIDQALINWLKTTWIGVLLILIICTSFLFLLFTYTPLYRRHLDYIYVLPMSLLVYAISYKLAGVHWPKATIETGIGNKYKKSKLTAIEAEKYKKRLNVLLMEQKLYLNKELRLIDLSARLNIPNHRLSQVLNQHMDISFYDLINRCRVMEAKKMIQSSPQLTLLQIAYDAGFNNKTSFVNAFKKFEGQTPSSFMKSILK